MENELESSSEDSVVSDEDQDNNDVPGGVGENDSLLDTTDSSDSDSEDDMDAGEDMEVDENALNEELCQINDILASNPYSYDTYIQKIKIMKQIGELGKLRDTREKFSELYPLSDVLWLDWLRDEVKLACSDEEKEEVIQLFERAVTDYLSVDLWLEYINFRISCMDAENGQQKCREVFERALGSCGLHVSMGSLVWDMYRDFEAALLGATTTADQIKEQENRFTSLCKRQLSVPLLGMTKTYEDVKSKIEIEENVEIVYKKALEKLNTLETWEAKLVQETGDKKVEVYRNYLELEKKAKSNPARIQCLYERAVSDYPLDSSLWLEYLEYLSKNLKIEAIVTAIAHRASRNCSWDVNVWLKYMNIVEEFSETDVALEIMKTVFEKAIMYASLGETAGTLWLKYLEFLRRKIDFTKPSEQTVAICKKTFDAAEQHLLQLLPEPNDYVAEIMLFRMRFVAKCAKGITDEVTSLWKDILTRGYSQYSRTWLQYILLEVSWGADTTKLRAIYKKAISTVQDDLSIISNLWVNFERDNGDITTMQQCESKISKEMARSIVTIAGSEFQASTDIEKNTSEEATVIPKGTKRKINSDDSQDYGKRKRSSEDAVDSDKTDTVFKIPSVPTDSRWKHLDKKRTPAVNVPRGESVKHDPSKDNRTVFLSNLAFTTEEAEITSFFNDIGNIEEIRLARDFKGRSKGFGYVCFATDELAKKALGKDRQPISGRPAFVSKCDPDGSTRQKQFKYPTSLERNKLFIKGLPFSFTADELRDLFKVHGDLKDCRLVTYRNGHSKGLAYVEFIDEACASQAILKTDGIMIEDKKISVAISNPPVRDASKSNKDYAWQKTSAANAGNIPQRRNPKAFVPRSIQINSTKSTQQSTATNSPKSNQDFRKMFLK